MIAVQVCLMSIALVMINTVQHGSANELCVGLLVTEPNFKMGGENKYLNFKNAFKNLSIESIKNKFMIKQEDTSGAIKFKRLHEKLTIGYFNDLLKYKRLSFNGLECPSEWCIKQVHKIFGDSLSDPGAVQDHLNKCKEYTEGYLLQNEANLKGEGILEMLYLNWTEEKLLNEINAQRKTSLSLAINMTALFIENYSLAYFRYFGQNVDERNTVRKCRSIETFCAFDGHDIVTREGLV